MPRLLRMLRPLASPLALLALGTGLAAATARARHLAQQLREATAARAELEQVLRSLPDIVWFKDAQGRYRLASDAFFAFHGRSRQELIGRAAHELFAPDLAAQIERGDRAVLASGRRYSVEGHPAVEGRRDIWLNTVKLPVHDEGERLLGILGVAHDITARKAAEETLARQARYAHALARTAQLFLDRGERGWSRVSEGVEQLRAAVGASRCFVYNHRSAPGMPDALVAETSELATRHYQGAGLPWEELPPEFRNALSERRWFGGPVAGRWPDYPRFQALYDDNGIQSTLVVPIFVDGRLWGHMGFSDRSAPRVWDDATIQLLFTAAELLAAALATWTDAQQLQERTSAAEAADRAKSAFLAAMSHEIRTPLNAVIGAADLLLSGPIKAEQRSLAQLIHDGGEALLAVIDDILDFSKIEAGRLELERSPFDLHRCLDEALGLVRETALRKGLALTLERDPALPRYVLGDGLRLRQILLNLLANAVKFTERGYVCLRASADLSDAAVASLELRVADSGVGITADRLEQIFEPFTQADSSTTRRFGGTGLGLAICRQLAGLMGGTVTVRSEPGRGTTFSVALPLEPAAAPSATVGSEPAPALCILVAEDNPVNREVTRRMLTRLGYQPAIVGDGEAVVAAVATGEYDLVLMDVQLPGLDGLEATRRIRALGTTIRQPRIVALTANALRDDRERFERAGIDGYLAKPVRVQGLLEVLSADGGSPRATDNDRSEPQLLDYAAITAQVELFAADSAGAQLVLELLDAELGAQVVQLEQALANGDRERMARLAHRLRGGSGQLGALALAKLARTVEQTAPQADPVELRGLLAAVRACHAATVAAARARLAPASV